MSIIYRGKEYAEVRSSATKHGAARRSRSLSPRLRISSKVYSSDGKLPKLPQPGGRLTRNKDKMNSIYKKSIQNSQRYLNNSTNPKKKLIFRDDQRHFGDF